MRVDLKQIRRWSGFLLLLLTLIVGLGLSAAVVQAETPEGDVVRVLAADTQGLSLEVWVPELSMTLTQGPDDRSYLRLGIAGFVNSDEAGRPTLPERGLLLAVPPAATLELAVYPLAERVVELGQPIYPAPAAIPDVTDGVGQPNAVRETFAFDAMAYAAAAPYPATLAVLEDAGYLRDVRLARLIIRPVQYWPSQGRLRHVQQMRVEVRFAGARSASVRPSGPDWGRFDDVLRAAVLNPEQLDAFRADPPPPAFPPVALPLDRVRYRVTLRETGIYRLTYADLVGAGLPLATLDPRNLQMFQGDDEVAIEVTGAADGRFDEGDEIRFYARAVDSPYTDINTFWLVVGDVPGRRMAQRSVPPGNDAVVPWYPHTEHFELDRIYRSAMPMEEDADHWYWGQTYVISRSSQPTLTVPFTIAHPAPTGVVSLTVELWGASYDLRLPLDHHTQLLVNGTAVGDMFWSGAVRSTQTITFSQELLRNGGNTLTLFSPGDTGARDASGQPWEVTWLNWFDLTYRRTFTVTADRLAFTPLPGVAEFALTGWTAPAALLYDVTDPLAPVALSGFTFAVDPASVATTSHTLRFRDIASANATYHAVGVAALASPLSLRADAPSGLRTEAVGADYLIIAHGSFVAGVERLAGLRRSQGMRVRVIDVQDVYDEFSAGVLTPRALRDFIAYAYYHWPRPAPAYVLLVGDGTYDFLDREGYGGQIFVPPYLALADPILGETAADNRYVTVVGDDLVPDLHLGRLPANNQAELSAMLDKIIAYDQAPAGGDWRQRMVFVADNPDYAGNFTALSELAAARVPAGFAVRRIYLGTPEYPLTAVVQAQQATLGAFNDGALLFNYVGHSSIGNWAAEFLLGVNALGQANNGSRYPVMLPMTCLEGSYHSTRFPSFGENVVRLSGRGAVASWSPTGLGVASGHDYMHQGFYEAVFERRLYQLGPATLAGKLSLFVNSRFADGRPRFHDLLDTYVLLGDPATELAIPKAQLTLTGNGSSGEYVQGDLVRYTLAYSNTGTITVPQAVLTAELPPGLVDLAWQGAGTPIMAEAGARLTWHLAQLTPGAAGQVTITGRIPFTITTDTLVFRATLAASGYLRETDDSDNQVGPWVVTLPAADLRAKQVAGPLQPVLPGQLVTFTLAYLNQGPGLATGIRITLPLPLPLDEPVIYAVGPALTPIPGQTYAWDVAPMRSGEGGAVTLVGRIPLHIGAAHAVWEVTGRIAATWSDPDLSNNLGETVIVTVLILDSYEPDDTMEEAQRVVVPLPPQPHTFHAPSDQDWFVFRARAGVTYLVRGLGLRSNGDTVLLIWDANGVLLAKNDPNRPGEGVVEIFWTAPADGHYYVLALGYTSPVGASYELEIQPQLRLYLPWVLRGL